MRQAASLTRKVGKYGLGHVLCQMGVAADQSERGRIDEIDMPRHQFAESRFGVVFGVAPQELSVVVHGLFTYLAPAVAQSGQDFDDVNRRWTIAVRLSLTEPRNTQRDLAATKGDSRKRTQRAQRPNILFLCSFAAKICADDQNFHR
jgi:hypothetical protein